MDNNKDSALTAQITRRALVGAIAFLASLRDSQAAPPKKEILDKNVMNAIAKALQLVRGGYDKRFSPEHIAEFGAFLDAVVINSYIDAWNVLGECIHAAAIALKNDAPRKYPTVYAAMADKRAFVPLVSKLFLDFLNAEAIVHHETTRLHMITFVKAFSAVIHSDYPQTK